MPVQDLILDLAIRYGFQVLGAFVILGVGFAVAWWVGNAVERPLTRMALEPPMRRLMVRVVRVVVLLFALVIALDKFGFQIAPLVAGIGVAGRGSGIALQGVLGNVIAGLTIIFTKPFRVGEHVEVVGMKGDVHTIELFSTTLLHPDRSRIIIPNRKIVGEILHNFGNTRQIHLAVMVPHGSDLAAVLAMIREVVVANPTEHPVEAAHVVIVAAKDQHDLIAGGIEIGKRIADGSRCAGIRREVSSTLT